LASVLPKVKKTVSSPLIAVQSNGSKPPFFCAHGADGYGGLARYLGPDQPFYGLAQHLERGKVRHTSIEAIATHYVREIRSVQPAGPYYIGGHSIGGLIALEMVQQLQKLNQEVALLVVFDSGPPPRTQPLGTNDPSHHSREEQFAKSFAFRPLKRNLWFTRHRIDETLHKMTKAVTCRVYHHLGIPLPPTLKTFYVDQVVYGTIYPKAHRSYVPRAYSGRAVYLKSEDTRDRVAGWQKLMTDGLEIRQVPGNHLSMLAEPHLRSLALTLKECLAKARERARFGTQSGKLSSQAKCDETPS
jgi:aspartate racemase